MAQLTALDIANAFVQLANEVPGGSVDLLKLNKLCYFAQAYHLARFGTPLFGDETEAWTYGPSYRSVYDAYKKNGRNPIHVPIEPFDEGMLSSDELNVMTDVFMNYGQLTAIDLMNKTHESGSPWAQIFVEGKNKVIPTSVMETYYRVNNEIPEMKINDTVDNVAYGIRHSET
ncbi:MAG: DUF4065 domain-containing protein [Bacteroidales bacterium]|nr:DUF4065 domain-containing protein [Bacteroidales bacterium]